MSSWSRRQHLVWILSLATAAHLGHLLVSQCQRQHIKDAPCMAVVDGIQRCKQDVIERLHQLRRAKPAATWQWAQYCMEHGTGVRNPQKLPETFVQRFLAREAEGSLPYVELATEPMADKVRAFQRSGGKDASKVWDDYSFAAGFGIRDPRYNTAQLVQGFLDLYVTPKDYDKLHVSPAFVKATDKREHWFYDSTKVVMIPPAAIRTSAEVIETLAPQVLFVDDEGRDAEAIHRYSTLLAQKVQKALQVLRSSKLPLPPEVTVYESARYHFRMRCWLEVDRSGGGFQYKEGTSHLQTDILGNTWLNRALNIVRARVQHDRALRRSLHSVMVHTSSGGDAVVMLTYAHTLPEGWRAAASKMYKEEHIPVVGIASPSKNAKYAWWAERQGRVLCNRDWVWETFTSAGRILEYQQVVGLFAQPNHGICQHMLDWAESHTRDSGGDLLELYCGNGCFTLALAHNFRQCLATEISGELVKLARDNAAHNQIRNVKILQMSSDALSQALRQTPTLLRDADESVCCENFNFSTVLVDPPRDGLDRFTSELVKSYDRILYISCNPHTLARDLGPLSNTHALKALAFFDQFPYTEHLECGAVLDVLSRSDKHR